MVLIKARWSRHRTSLLRIPTNLIIATFSFVAFFSIFLALNHSIFNTYAWDTGIFNQVLWSTLNGRPFYYTMEPFWSANNNFLATHFSPILILVLPFYALYPSVETLFVIHSAIIALGGIVTYKLSYLVLKNEKYALMFSVLYFFNPLVLGQAFSSFHLEDLFMTLMMFTIYFFIKGDWWKYFVFLALTLMTIEYAAIPVIFFGITMLLTTSRRESSGRNRILIPLITISVSLLYFFLAQNMQLALGLVKAGIHQEWKILGANSITEVPLRILENPVAALDALSYDSFHKTFYLLMVFAPVLFLPLLKPAYLIPISPWLVTALFSNYLAYYVVFTQYPAFVAPFIFLGAIYGFRKIARSKNIKVAHLKKLVSLAFLIAVTLSLFAATPRVETTTYLARVKFQHAWKLHEILGLVPSSASILAQDNIFPHVSDRFEAYTIPSPSWEGWASKSIETLNIMLAKKPEYIIIDLEAIDPASRAIGNLMLETLSKQEGLFYGIFAEYDGIYLFKLDYKGSPSMSSA